MTEDLIRTMIASEIKEEHLEEIKAAKLLLENPNQWIQIANKIGKPIELGMNKLPEKFREPINKAVHKSIEKAVNYVAYSFNEKIKIDPLAYKVASAATGFGGGFFGFPGLFIELPITTMMILRAILETAKNKGGNINDLQTRLSCIEVFALGGISSKDNASESGYYTVRIGITKAINEVTKYITGKGLAREGAPFLIRLITNISARYGIVVSEKIMAQSLPILGGLTGAAINTIFMDHFQKMASGHFTIQRLERIYDPSLVKEAYDSISME